jgi:elongator complex protein 2
MQKLYGHGYEIFACATHPDGSLIASACKANKSKYAEIILWSASSRFEGAQRSFRQLCTLAGHELTIVQMAFSNDGQYLLSVSRDRSWILYKRSADESATQLYNPVRRIATSNAHHTRIVWSCAWSHDDKYFVTASRDKRVCVWHTERSDVAASAEKPVHLIELGDSVNACSFAPALIGNEQR